MNFKRIIKAGLTPISKLLKLNNNMIVFRSSNGERFDCNPKYIYNYLINHCSKDIKIVWIFDNPDKYKNNFSSPQVKLCKSNSLPSLFYMMSAKVIVDNNGVPSFLPFNKNQITINTWHGGGSYKKRLSLSQDAIDEALKITKYVSSCKRFSQKNLILEYGLDQNKILETGMPRNDLFFMGDDHLNKIKQKVKNSLNIDKETKIILYAPTYRSYDKSAEILDADRLISACEKRFGGRFILATRCHRFDNQNNFPVNANIVDTNSYDDLQEVIAAADVVITDYSSIMWDVSFTKAPCFIYAVDVDKYLGNRGFYTPIETWPFPISKSNIELEQNVLNFNPDDYNKRIKEHQLELGSFENGTAAKNITEYILNSIKK